MHGLEVLELDDEVAVVQPVASKGASGEALDASNEALGRVEKDAGPRDVMLIQPSIQGSLGRAEAMVGRARRGEGEGSREAPGGKIQISNSPRTRRGSRAA